MAPPTETIRGSLLVIPALNEARSIAAGSLISDSTGYGSLQVQLSWLTTDGVLTRSRHPNRSWIGSSTNAEPA